MNSSFIYYYRDDLIYFTCFNEQDEPIFDAIYDKNTYDFNVLEIYENVILTRASSAAWGCGMGLGTAGSILGYAIGAACPPAGILVGISYTAFAIWACDGL